MKRPQHFLTALFLAIVSFSLNAQGIKTGPWISDASETSVTILWTSEVPGMAYVELEDGTTLYDTFAGRRIFQRLHSVKVEGLSHGQVLRYRVCGVNLKDDSSARNPSFEGGYTGPWNSVRTMDSKASSCRFSVFNDIHMKTDKYRALAGQVDSAATDFLFLNGDIVTAGNLYLTPWYATP